MLLFLTNFNLSGSDIQRIGWDGENLTDTLTVYVDTIATGDYYLDMEDEAGNKNIVALLKDTSTHTLHVDLTKEMIGAAGMKKLQMRLCSGEETIKKSNVISVFTGASINASEPFQHTSPSEFEEVERRVSEALQQAADYGVKGDKGDKGDTGATGAQGPQGIQGETGPAGADGKGIAVMEFEESGGEVRLYITDTDGDSYLSPDLKGPQGVKGDTGAKGDKGEKGDTGATGATGPQGETGPQGATGATGATGAAGADGNDGTTFTPAVSSAGVISWTNDGGKQNPQSVDIVAAVLAALPTWTGGAY